MASLNTKPLSTEDKLLDWIKPDERELARHSDREKTRLLSENLLARGQLQDAAALEDGRMIFGHGRWLAAKAAGLKTIRVKIYPASLTDTEIMLIRAAENLQRNELTGYQKWLLCSDLMACNPTWQHKDLAQALNLDPSMVTRLLSPSGCTKAWQEALKEGKVGVSDCYAARKLPLEQQDGLLALKLSGASRDTIEQAGRKKRIGGKEAVRVQRVKCILPSGVNVVVSGEGVSLDESIEALGEAIKEMKRARDLGYTAKTFAAAMKDKSKKG